jgi:hypothetical protein
LRIDLIDVASVDDKALYRAQNEAYKIEKTKKWEKSMNDRELER